MAYNYRFTLSKYRILRRHKRRILFLFLLLLFVLGCYLAFIWYIHQDNGNDRPQTDIRTKTFTPLSIFKTPYFTFEADKTWHFEKSESTDKKFLYRSSKKNIVMADLTVYVDSLPPDLLLTHVLPVAEANDRFIVGEVSGHCRDYIKNKIKPGDNSPVEATIESVRIKCQVDGTSSTVGTGKKGGSYKAILGRDNATQASYYLLYHDLQFIPHLDNFTNVVRSFRSK